MNTRSFFIVPVAMPGQKHSRRASIP
eukprot:SAG11_NODE_30188_length_303_cov_0.936275_1_plen_25_part_01